MADLQQPQTELAFLPDGIINGWAVNSHRVKDENGVEHAVTILTLDFQVGPGHTARQSFIMARDDGNKLRQDLKRPTPIRIPTPDTPTDTPKEITE